MKYEKGQWPVTLHRQAAGVLKTASWAVMDTTELITFGEGSAWCNSEGDWNVDCKVNDGQRGLRRAFGRWSHPQVHITFGLAKPDGADFVSLDEISSDKVNLAPGDETWIRGKGQSPAIRENFDAITHIKLVLEV